MAIFSLRLQNFRLYKDESFEFEPGVNIVVGPNTAGKTTLLEAITVLATGSSYKARDGALIRHGAPWARADGFFKGGNRTVKIVSQGELTIKDFVVVERPYKRLSLERSVPIVLFEPEQLQLLSRGPEARREYFDDLLERSLSGYGTIRRQYKRVLAQRNALLKRGPGNSAKQLFAWNLRLSELGGKIAAARAGLVDNINTNLSRSYSQIAGKRVLVETRYESQFGPGNYSSRLLAKLEAAAELDMLRGFTAYGPHREDIAFYLAGRPLSQSASRGETRSLLLALKLYELALIEASRGQKPIFLLDDVFSELDRARRRALIKHLKNYQTIITTTDADAVLEYFAGEHNIVPLSKSV